MIQNEIDTLVQYIDYIRSLKGKLCEMFGHDCVLVKSGSGCVIDLVECKCCGRTMPYDTYVESHKSAKYRIMDNCRRYNLPGNDYLVTSSKDLVLSLPEFKADKTRKKTK